jgi:hypothetical protein
MAYAADMPLLIGLAVLAFWLYCLFDVFTSPEEAIRTLSRPLWALIVILLPVAGGALWILFGRRPAREPLPAGRRAGSAPMGPDDDPDFLRYLDQRLHGDD